MNFYHISLLLLVVLSAYSEGPQHAKPPEPLDSSVATVCLKSSHIALGFLAPVLYKHEGSVFVLPQNNVHAVPQNEVHVQPQNGVLKSVPAYCQLPCNLKNILDFVLDVQVKGFKIWTWVLLHSMEKLGF